MFDSPETSYGDPIETALRWQADGRVNSRVDLAAAFGRGSNAELMAQLIGKLDVAVELSGGIQDDKPLTRALATGCARVNLGYDGCPRYMVTDVTKDGTLRDGDAVLLVVDQTGPACHTGTPTPVSMIGCSPYTS